ncbi:MAG: hypothetical protein HeimC3_07810 [Candidatus Heimdallarchaeota archaeon LC_3]|nr:MAG: hypothetical protein HeimC3_07810 [Candidatus Heimdallarchaeota archaeon LC_3]
MNLIMLLRFFVPLLTMLVILYVVIKFTFAQKHKSSKELSLNFTIGLGLIALGSGIFSITPLLENGQVLLAELSLGGSLILMMLGMVFYVEYWHALYKKIPWISKLFYFSVGGGFILLLNNPWEIFYSENYGYTQNLSEIFIAVLILQFVCGVVIIILSLRSIKMRIDSKIIKFENIIQNELQKEDQIIQKIALTDVKINLEMKNRRIDLIAFSFIFGIFLIGIGFLPNIILIDFIGILIAYGPQAYILSKDSELILYLLSQRPLEETKNLQNNVNLLPQQFNGSSEIPQSEIQALINFIEKADAIFYEKDHNV